MIMENNFSNLIKKAIQAKSRYGWTTFFKYSMMYALYGEEYFRQGIIDPGLYRDWILKNENWDAAEIRREIEAFSYKPKISIITPVYNIAPEWLDKCVESVKNQIYDRWELCLYDDASTKKETVGCLKKWEGSDSRIRISYGKENRHISGASNEALKMATGEFVAFLDNDDELAPDALFENVRLLNRHPEADFIYSDEDKMRTDGTRLEPFFKPDWSPDLFLSMNYTCHLGVYRKKIIDEIGGFRKGYEGSQDYDLVLRFLEKTKPENIFHIPKILYHWRKIPGSVAAGPDSKNYAYAAAKKAIGEFLRRRGEAGEVLDASFTGSYRVKRKISGQPAVSIIIPFRDRADVLKKCVGSLLEKTNYRNYEIILVDNQSREKETLDYLESLGENPKIKILKYDKPFNFSALNNFAAENSKNDFLLFLNNDTEVINPDWLEAMLEQAQRKEVGVVGARLLYPNGKIQHAGVVLGLGGVAGHAFRLLPRNNVAYFGHSSLIRDYSAVTGACLMIKKDLFRRVGGFDEDNFVVAYNDVDLCLKVRQQGYLVVYTPYAELYHHEGLSRGNDENFKAKDPEKYRRYLSEQENLKKKWREWIDNDPYYNPNLTRVSEDFGLRMD